MDLRTRSAALALATLVTLGIAACGPADARQDADAAPAANTAEAAGSHVEADHATADHAAMAVDPSKLVVYKTESCGCCGKWVEHMKANGFDVVVHDMPQEELAALKTARGIGPELASCHTAEIGGFLVEGHVPAADVKRMLAEKPEGAVGIAVPGMPIGAPGMEIEGEEAQEYEVVLFDAAGTQTEYAAY